MGYPRADGTAGIRNYTVVVPAVTCANDMAFQLAQSVEGCIALCHSYGCIAVGEDRVRGRRGIVGLGINPNIFAALVVGVGCEAYAAKTIAEQIGQSGTLVKCLVAKDYPDLDDLFAEGRTFLSQAVAQARAQQRTACPLSRLTLGLKCGGSGSVSLLSNNPAVGRAVDLLIGEGGTAILSETAELIGAEKILAQRAASRQVADDVYACVGRLEQEITRHGIDILGSEPTPGNIISGLTTIEEKSLGSVAKGGTTPLQGVLEYGQRPDGHGLYFMDSEAAAGPLFAGMIAAGAQLSVFSLAGGMQARFRGMPSCAAGIPTLPVIKVLGSNEDADQRNFYDAYTGDILTGVCSIEQAGERIFETILAVASGEATYTEQHSRYQETIRFYMNGLVM